MLGTDSHTRAHAHVAQKQRLPEGSGRTLHGKMKKIKSYRHQNDNDVGKEHSRRPDPESTEHSLGWRDWVTFTILQIPCRMNVSPEPPLGSLLHGMRTRALAGTATSDPRECPHSRRVASGMRVTADSRGWGRGRRGSMRLGVFCTRSPHRGHRYHNTHGPPDLRGCTGMRRPSGGLRERQQMDGKK